MKKKLPLAAALGCSGEALLLAIVNNKQVGRAGSY